MRFLGPHRPLTQTEAMDWFDDALHKPSRFAIADAKTDEFIGFCGLKKINDIWDFGYFLRSEFWGRGIAFGSSDDNWSSLKWLQTPALFSSK